LLAGLAFQSADTPAATCSKWRHLLGEGALKASRCLMASEQGAAVCFAAVVHLIGVCRLAYRDGYEISGSIQGLGTVYKAGAVLFLIGGACAGFAISGPVSIPLFFGGFVMAVAAATSPLTKMFTSRMS
jgi:hypothetical protein